ncbi:MAG: DUF4258 domain-containing protein [SAR324 cluster bacterium]|nr:DUF4258 domain-containing protein [SAR324 cluster bacterium]
MPSLDAEKRCRFKTHALQRMFERGFTIEKVKQALIYGESIAQYPAE